MEVVHTNRHHRFIARFNDCEPITADVTVHVVKADWRGDRQTEFAKGDRLTDRGILLSIWAILNSNEVLILGLPILGLLIPKVVVSFREIVLLVVDRLQLREL